MCPASYGSQGAAWALRRASVASGFETQFAFRFSNRGSTPGADGLAFVVQNAGSRAIGQGGGAYIGYSGMVRSLAVELDTWANTDSCIRDLNDNHVAVHTRGEQPNTVCSNARLGHANVPFNLRDGQTHVARISYANRVLRVFFDGASSPTLTVNVDLGAVNGGSIFDGSGRAWVGFTAATGGAWNDHDVMSWSLVEGDCRPTPRIGEAALSRCEGGEVSFNVDCEGAGSLSYRWRRNGVEIDPAANPTAVTSRLELAAVHVDDEGTYDCVVTNACGDAVSDAATFVTCACLDCPADFNRDGGVDGADVTEFFAAWESGNCDADTDADGGVGGLDVEVFFAAWEAGGC